MREITLDATVENITKVTAFVDGQLEQMGCPKKAKIQINIAVDELFSNIAKYAYGDKQGQVVVRVEMSEEPKAVVLTFIDQGVRYNPLEKEDPDVTRPAEEREIGGLGIYIVKKSMDEICYKYEGGKNILCIKKWL